MREYWDAYENKLIAEQEQTDKTVIEKMAQGKGVGAAYTTELAETIANDAMSKADLMYSELMSFMAYEGSGKKHAEAFAPSVLAEFEQAEQSADTQTDSAAQTQTAE